MLMKIFGFVMIAVMVTMTVAAGGARPIMQQAGGAQDREGGISGVWSATFTVEGMAVPVMLKFAEKDGKVTGTVESDHTGPGTIEDGTWKDNTLSCTFKFEKHESIAVSGTLKGEIFAGESKTEGRQGTWEAKRGGTNSVMPR